MATLSADQVDAIYQAARPLEPADSTAFLEDVAAAIADLPEIGDGALHRIIRNAQRTHFDPPSLEEAHLIPFRRGQR